MVIAERSFEEENLVEQGTEGSGGDVWGIRQRCISKHGKCHKTEKDTSGQ